MPTGSKRTNFVNKRHLPQQRVKDTFFDYLADEIHETAVRIWGTRRGVFGVAVLQGDGTDRFKVSTLPIELLDGNGRILILDVADAEDVYFENTVGIDYYIGAQWCQIPDEVVRNPRTGTLHYDTLEDRVGVTAVPDSVVDGGGFLTVVVDAIFEAGVSHDGRLVTIWLNSPQTADESVAIERDLVVNWDGFNNVVTTVGTLGQGTVSTTASDYAVAATGVTVRRLTDLRVQQPFAFLGIVTGAGIGVEPALFDTTDQVNVLSGWNPTLDLAYDGGIGSVTPGAGRTIVVDAGAVEVSTVADPGNEETGDAMNAQLRLNRLESEDYFQAHVMTIGGNDGQMPLVCLQPLHFPPVVTDEMAALVSGVNLIDLTDVGVDLTDPQVRCNAKLNLVLVEDCPQAGLYVIDTFGVSSINVKTLQGVNPATWPDGTATVRLLVPRFALGGAAVNPAVLDWLNGPTFVLRDGYAGGQCDFRILAEGNGRFVILDNSETGMATYQEPRELLTVDPAQVGVDLQWPIRLHRSTLVHGGTATGAPGEEAPYDRDGVRIYDAEGAFTERDMAFALAVDAGYPEDVPALHTLPTFAVERYGALDRGHHFRDDFVAHPLGALAGPYYTFTVGAGTALVKDIADGAGYGHGCVELVTGAVLDDVTEVGLEPICFNLDTDYDFRWTYRARLKVDNIVNFQVLHGFYQTSVVRRFYFIMDYLGDPDGTIRGAYVEPGPVVNVTAPICLAEADKYQWFEIMLSPSTVFFTVERKDHAAGYFGSESASITTLAGEAGALGISLYCKTKAAASKKCILDFWEVWDREALVARHGTSHNLQHP